MLEWTSVIGIEIVPKQVLYAIKKSAWTNKVLRWLQRKLYATYCHFYWNFPNSHRSNSPMNHPLEILEHIFALTRPYKFAVPSKQTQITKTLLKLSHREDFLQIQWQRQRWFSNPVQWLLFLRLSIHEMFSTLLNFPNRFPLLHSCLVGTYFQVLVGGCVWCGCCWWWLCLVVYKTKKRSFVFFSFQKFEIKKFSRLCTDTCTPSIEQKRNFSNEPKK